MSNPAPYSSNRPCRLNQVPRWDFEADAVIIGFGASGACAAIEAASAGAKVILFELAAGSGGASALSGGDIYMGGNGGTPIQRSAGFEDATEDMIRYLTMAGGPNADVAKIRNYAENSTAHFEWLVSQGVKFKNSFIPEKTVEPQTDDCLIYSGSEEAWPFAEQAKPCPRGHTPQMEGPGGGKYLMEVLTARVNELGVDVHYNTRALALIADEANRVHGVVVRIDGSERFVRARRGVILCAGGFDMTQDMVKRHVPMLLRANTPIGTAGDDGTGIRLGMSVGGSAINMDQGFVTSPFYPPSSLVKGIFVNELGQRYINEDVYHGRVAWHSFQQPGNKIYLLADSAIYDRPFYSELLRSGSIVATGETWEEVEQELALPEGSLTSTVAVYNRYAEHGEDPLFHKAKKWLKPLNEAPFVALDFRIDHCVYSCFTLGGLDTLPSGEVLNADREVIPGLFAAGRTACGIPRWAAGYSSGMSVGDASFTGRMAGRQIAKTPVLAAD
jgi:succinate dehydrogenase/fumarate reductase flavoprotein subunit